MAFKFTRLSINDVVEITPDAYKDDRGIFAELFKKTEFEKNGLLSQFVQVNSSRSVKNVLRGLHYQLNPKAQGKLVSVTQGEIFDVAVDIRKSSATYGQWVSSVLSSEKKNMLYIPPGFAHGFCALSDIADVVYYCTEEYSPNHERGVLWSDPAIGVEWPVSQPIVSEKDVMLPLLKDAENNFV